MVNPLASIPKDRLCAHVDAFCGSWGWCTRTRTKFPGKALFGFYVALNFTVFLLVFFVVPETKQLTLEELDYVFGVPTRRHLAYQIRTWLPWWLTSHVLWQRKAQLLPLDSLEGFKGWDGKV